jgi:hypothetical protein
MLDDETQKGLISTLFRDITQRISLPTFRDHISVPFSRVKKSKIFQKSVDLIYFGPEI